MVSHQGDLLSEVGVGAEDHHFGGGPADTFFALLSVDSAPPGTKLTMLEEAVGSLHPLSESTLSFEFFIGRSPGFQLFGLGRVGNLRKKQRTTCEERTSDEFPPRHFHTGNSATHPTKGWYFKATELSSDRFSGEYPLRTCENKERQQIERGGKWGKREQDFTVKNYQSADTLRHFTAYSKKRKMGTASEFRFAFEPLRLP